jgi:hypothetical protein
MSAIRWQSSAPGIRLAAVSSLAGPKGDTGNAATITVGTTTTLAAGEDATVVNSGTTGAAVLDFGIPEGEQGVKGDTGNAATIAVGTVTTLSPGASATVTNVGTSGAAVFDFGIPQGAPGTMGGSLGTTDNIVPRSDGAGGTTLQAGLMTNDDSGNLFPNTSDTGSLGTSTNMWADLFLASGGVVNWNNGDVTVTHSANALAFAGASSGYSYDAIIKPSANDGAPLGSTSASWSDLFLASGAVINYANSDFTITHSSGSLTMSGTLSLGTSNAFTCGSIELGAASDTTLTRGAAGVLAVEGVNVYPNIPQNSKSAAYTLVLGDANTHILHPTADNNARTFTIPDNSSVAFPIGTTITFVNEINTVTISITTDTLKLAGAGSTGSRTLAANGMATAIKTASTTWWISGTGLT